MLMQEREWDVFKRQHLGKNSFLRVAKEICLYERNEGSGEKNWVAMYGLRETLATIWLKEGALTPLSR